MKFKLVGIGEVLWDLLPGGRQMGGAPANFAYHACALGGEGRVVSRVGRDQAGRDLIQRLEQLGIPTGCMEEDPAAATGAVTVEVAADGQPHFTIHENVAWDYISGGGAGTATVAAADAVCFGTLAQRSEVSRRGMRNLLQAAASDALRIFDVNVRQDFCPREVIEQSLALANALKVNEPELRRLADMFRLRGDERGQIGELARRFKLRVVAYTRGSQGSLLHADGCWSEHLGLPTSVADTVGAGDSFTAALALGLLAGWPLDESHRCASEVAAFVCSQDGATPELPDRLRAPFVNGPTPGRTTCFTA